MKIFTKKETLLQNITYMAIMAAINVVFILLTTFLPYLYFLLLFLLPLTSTFVMVFCKKRYYIIYSLATIGLCFLASFNNIGDTFFYIIPLILTGAITGLLIEKQFNGIWIIILTSLIQFIISIIALPLIKLITEVNLVDSLFTLLNIQDFEYRNYVILPIFYFVSLTQMAITYLVLKNEVSKLGINIKTSVSKLDLILLTAYEFFAFIVMFICVFINKELTLISLLFGLIPSIFLLVFEITLFDKIRLIVIGATVLIFPIIYAILYPLISSPDNYLIISILFILINIPTICRVFQKNLGLKN